MSSQGRSGLLLKPGRVIPTVLACAIFCTLALGLVAPAPVQAAAPLAFEPNEGQADPAVRFLARGRGYGLFLTPTETVLVMSPRERAAVLGRRPGPGSTEMTPPSIVRMRLIGSDPDATVTGVDRRPGVSNYLVGPPERWRRGVPTFGRVHYADVYPGVSLVFYGNERQIEYDFVVAPGADPSAVVLAFEGADGLRVDADGDLVLPTPAGDLRLHRPVIYQDVDGTRRPIEGGYVVDGNRVRFRVAAYDAARPLVIDPVIGYSTYLGGGLSDSAFGIAVDALNNVYVAGSTLSSDFPVSSTPIQSTLSAGTDAFVVKLGPTGTVLYSTYLGGGSDDTANAIAVDPTSGVAVVVGATQSTNFPTFGAPFQTILRGGNDAFVAKLSADGASLVYSGFLGSDQDDFAFGVALDAAGNAYVTGSTLGTTFPNNNAVACLNTKAQSNDAFVVKVNPDGSGLGYCRFIGGNNDETGQAIAVDASSNVYVAGSSSSPDFPILGALQTNLAGGLDGFVAKLDNVGNPLFATLLGGALDDEALAIAVAPDGTIVVAGTTLSDNFPTLAAIQIARRGGTDAFVTRLAGNGASVVYSTYLGGSTDDVANGVAVHTDGTVYVVGSTLSTDFPVFAGLQPTLAGGMDAFVTKLNAAGNGFVYSTYLGGSTGDDAAQAVAVDADGIAYVTGTTGSGNFPTVSPNQGPGGTIDAFVAQIADGGVIQFSAATYTVQENGSAITITVQRTGDISGATTVEFFTQDDTATANADYVPASGVLNFSTGQTVATFVVTILDDAIGDGDERVTLGLRNATNGAILGTRSNAILTIVDNEPSINFETATFAVTENTASATIGVTRSGPTGGTVTVGFATGPDDPSCGTSTPVPGKACAGTDYVAVSRTITFAPGVTRQTVSIPIVNDTLAEGTETVNLRLDNVSGGTPPALLGVRSVAVLNISDNDVAGTVQFSKASFTVNENVATAAITVTRTGGTAAGVTVNYATSDGSATAGLDYTAASGTLTFGAGQASASFTVAITNDVAAEGDETVALTLSSPGGGAGLGAISVASLTIVDNEPTVSFNAPSFTVAEGTATATITVKRGGTAATASTVDFTTSAGTAVPGQNYTDVSGTLTFAAGGPATRTFTVPILNDTASGGVRTVRLTLSNPTGGVTIVTPSTATLSITDNDVGGSVEFSASSYNVLENAGSAVITVVRSGGTASGVTVAYRTDDGTAGPTDYTGTAGTLTFGAGETSKTFSVQVTDDAVAEGSETVTLTLSNAGGGGTLGARSTATLKIIDDELTFQFSAATYTVAEGGAVTITVERTGTSATPVTVGYATSDGTATALLDYTPATGTLTFAPGVTTRTFTVSTLQDTAAEGSEAFNVSLNSPSAPAQLAPRSTAAVTITDDDLGGAVEFRDATTSVLENAGTATITVMRTGGVASAVTVDYATSDGTAVGTLDYTPASGRLTFGAGETTRTFTIPILDDALGEGTEIVNLTLTNAGGGGTLGARTTATLEIRDDEPHVKLSAATYSVLEGAGTALVTVERGGVSTGTVTVDFATRDIAPPGTDKAVAGVDYTPRTGTLTFGPGVLTRTLTVPISNDTTPEAEEKFEVFLANATNTAGSVTIVTPDAALVSILDDDTGGTIEFSAASYTAKENGGSAVVTVKRTGGAAGGVSVTFQTGVAPPVTTPPTPAQTATGGTDYTETTATVVFGPGETTKTVTVPIANEATAEGSETVYMSLTNPLPAGAPGSPVLGTTTFAVLKVVDDESTVQFASQEFRVLEGTPATAIVVERTGTGGTVMVRYDTSDIACGTPGNACQGTDYVPVSNGMLTFGPGVTSQTISIQLLDNQGVEPDKTFRVTLSNVTTTGGAPPTIIATQPCSATTPGTCAADVIIRENDRGGTFSVLGGSVNEPDGTVMVTVSRTGGSAGPVSVNFHARRCGLGPVPSCLFAAREAAGGPTAPQHFVPQSNVLLTFGPGVMSQQVAITVLDNNIAEGSRNIGVSLTTPNPVVMQDGQEIGVILGSPDALVNIVEDELYFVTLSSDTYSTGENSGATTITVVRSGLQSFLNTQLVVNYSATPITATIDDFAAVLGSVTFAAGVTTQTFALTIPDDNTGAPSVNVVDGPKTVFIDLTTTAPAAFTPGGPALAFPSSALLTISDDDTGGSIQLSADTYQVVENVVGGMATITLTRTGGLAGGVTVVAEAGFAPPTGMVPQTASDPGDYSFTTATVRFEAGETSKAFQFPIVNDGATEGVETVYLRIRDPLAVPVPHDLVMGGLTGVGASPTLGPRTFSVLRIVDDEQTVAFALANYDVPEAAGTGTVTVERTGDTTGSLTVDFSTGPDDASCATTPGAAVACAGLHYTATSGTLTFGPGQTVASFPVGIVNNTIVTPDKVLNLALTNPSAGVVATGRDTATITIKDDDVGGSISLARAKFTVNEAAGPAVVTLVRTGGTAGGVTVDFATSDPGGAGSATAGSDYTAVTTTVTFAAGEFTKTVSITISTPDAVEGTETLNLTLSNPQPAGLMTRSPALGSQSTATLDILETEIVFGVTQFQTAEGAGLATITALRRGDLSGTSTVTFATGPDHASCATPPTLAGQGCAGLDYVATTGTLTFGPGDSVATFDVPIVNDTLVEADEIVNLALSAPSAGTTLGTPNVATILILDNDTGGTLAFAQPTFSVNETAGTATITVTRVGGSAGAVTVDFATADETALDGTDYTATTGTLTFASGDLSKTFTVPILNGTTGVKTATLLLSNAANGAVIGTPSVAALRIVDTGNTVFFSTTTPTVMENGGSAVVSVERTGATGTVTVNFATVAGGTATAGTDYTTVTGTLTFAPGVTSRTFSVPVLNDNVLESPETVTLQLSAPACSPACPVTLLTPNATLTILDDDVGGVVEFSASSFTVAENVAGGVGSVTLTRVGGTAGGVVVTYDAAAGTASPGTDFTPVTGGTVTFAAGATTATATVPVLDDALADGSKTVTFTITAVGPGGFPGSPIPGLRTSTTLTITDNEPVVNFASPTFVASEALATATLTVVRSVNTTVQVTVDYAVTGGSATGGGVDYTLPAGTLTFAPGQTSRTIPVTIVNDALVEGPETVIVTLSNPTPVGGVTLGTPSTATLTINDNDAAGSVQFNASTYTVSETTPTLRITVTRTNGNAGDARVNYAATGGTATGGGVDYTLAAGTLTFGVNETVKTFDIAIVADGLSEGNETIVLSLSNPQGGATLGAPSQATVTIVDDEQTLRFTAGGYTVAEGAAATITVERLGTPTGVVTVTFQTGDLFAPMGTQVAQTATAGVGGDYTSVNRILTFGAGVRTMNVSIPTVNDTLVEGSETVNLRITGATGATIASVNDGLAVLSITDNDQGGIVQFSVATYTVAESAASATITVTRTGGVASGVTVDYSTADGEGTATAGADYVSTSGTLTFAAGQASKTFTVPIMADTLDEANETVILRLANATGGASIGPRGDATLTITDDDTAGMIQFSVVAYTVAENIASGMAAVTVVRSGGSASGALVDFATSNGTGLSGATAGADYTAVLTTLTFGPAETSKIVNVPITNDGTAEGNEIIQLTLSNPRGGATLGPRSTATLQILDDEATLGFSAAAFTVIEGSTGTVTVVRTGPTTAAATVTFATGPDDASCATPPATPGVACAGVDYTAKTGVLTFGVGVKSRTFTVTTTGNILETVDRTINLTLSAPTGAALAQQSTAVLTIDENDEGGVVEFQLASYNVSEASASTNVVVVRRGGSAPITVPFTTVSSTAVGGLDFVTTSGTLTFPAGLTMKILSIPIVNDTVQDAAETFTITLGTPTGGATLGTIKTTTISIVDDDKAGTVELGANQFTVKETVGSAAVTVTRTGGRASAVSVTIATSDGTAVAGTDYTPQLTVLTFGFNEVSKTLLIPIVNRPGTQGPRTINLSLSTPTGGAVLGARTFGALTITDGP